MEKYLNPHTATAPSSEIEQMFHAMAAYAKSDIINAVNTAKTEGFDEGFDIGREQGIDIGREQGRNLRSQEIAKTMKGLGVDVETIAKSTGLSADEIVKL